MVELQDRHTAKMLPCFFCVHVWECVRACVCACLAEVRAQFSAAGCGRTSPAAFSQRHGAPHSESPPVNDPPSIAAKKEKKENVKRKSNKTQQQQHLLQLVRHMARWVYKALSSHWPTCCLTTHRCDISKLTSCGRRGNRCYKLSTVAADQLTVVSPGLHQTALAGGRPKKMLMMSVPCWDW